jgi:protein involved in polysaccharide export with SLBB domain
VTCAVRLAAPGALPVVGASPAATARNVFFIGAVRGTVELPADRNMRILEVVAKARASDSADADLDHVRVRRVGADGRPFTFEVNVGDIVERNQEQQNIVILENDIVIVPTRK